MRTPSTILRSKAAEIVESKLPAELEGATVVDPCEGICADLSGWDMAVFRLVRDGVAIGHAVMEGSGIIHFDPMV